MTTPGGKTLLLDIDRSVFLSLNAKVDSRVRTALNDDNLDAVDDAIMAHVDESPDDPRFAIPILSSLVRKKAIDRAETILQLITDVLSERGNVGAEAVLLRLVLEFWPSCVTARKRLEKLLHERYAGCSIYDRVAKHLAVVDPATPVVAFETLETWVRFDEGTGVYLAAKGVGKVHEVNVPLGKVRVMFVGEKGGLLSFGLPEARKTLEVLEEGSFFLDKLLRPEELQKQAEQNPGELLKRLFSNAGKSLMASELKEMLSGIVPSSRWSTWWNRARQDPRLVVGAGARPVCSWTDSAEAAEAQISQNFASAGIKEKLQMARKQSGRSKELDSMIAGELIKSAEEVLASKPSVALEIIVAAEKMQAADQDVVQQMLGELVQRSDFAGLIVKVADRAGRRRCVELAQKQRGDWAGIFLELLGQETDNQLLKYLYESLSSGSELEQRQQLVRQVLVAPETIPGLYMWLCREMNQRGELSALADWGFLRPLLSSMSRHEFKGHRMEMRTMFDPGGPADAAIGTLSEDQARLLLETMDKLGEPEDYRRARIRGKVLAMYRGLSDGEVESFYVTEEALESKRAEFMKLVKIDIPENTQELKRAKEHGDLSENFEYHAARARQELLSSRAKSLQDQLQHVRAIDPSTVDSSSVSIGTRVSLKPVSSGGNLEPLTLTVLGTWDSDPNRNILSYSAPSVNAILGAKVGDEVTYTEGKFVIEKIESWNPQA